MSQEIVVYEHVQALLREFYFDRWPYDSPLLDLDLVTLELRRQRLDESREHRRVALYEAIGDLIWERILRIHPDRAVQERIALAGQELEALAEDFALQSTELDGWSWLYFRYMTEAPRLIRYQARGPEEGEVSDWMSLVADSLHVSKRTLESRQRKAMERLVQVLREAEKAAEDLLADRGIRLGEDEPAGLGESVRDLLDALRGSDDGWDVWQSLSRDRREPLQRIPASSIEEYLVSRLAARWQQFEEELEGGVIPLVLELGGLDELGLWPDGALPREDSLAAVLARHREAIHVVLGEPGIGKTFLLEMLEMEMAEAALRGGDTLPLRFDLSRYDASRERGAEAPMRWLRARWQHRYPGLPDLDAILLDHPAVVLLDGLNEIARSAPGDSLPALRAWKQCLHDLTDDRPGTRVVVTCRTLDYAEAFSTPERKVPSWIVQPLDRARIEDYLQARIGDRALRALRGEIAEAGLQVVRTPFYLRTFVDQFQTDRPAIGDEPALVTALVRLHLKREIERGNPRFRDERLLSQRDRRRLTVGRRWPSAYALPEEGRLLPSLGRLALGLQDAELRGESRRLRFDHRDLSRHLGAGQHDPLTAAACDLGLLIEDPEALDFSFRHQLVQEYFAARQLVSTELGDRARRPWRVSEVRLSFDAQLEGLHPTERVPELPASGWEPSLMLAAVMSEQPMVDLDIIAEQDLPLAARCAALPACRDRLPEDWLEALRWRLVERSRDLDADIRARIEAGLALGDLGDPRYQAHGSGSQRCLTPPFVEVPAGRYRIGSDDGFPDERPAHWVDIDAFEIAAFPVTNAEYRCFIEAGGYEDERWWEGEAAKRWREGIGTGRGGRSNIRLRIQAYRERPDEFDSFVAAGTLNDEDVERWTAWMEMSESDLDAELHHLYPDGPVRQPASWTHSELNAPTQPVVGLSWYEACAYCRWSMQATGLALRLPTEVEWEAAAGGRSGFSYPYGERFLPRLSNTVELHWRRSTPVGALPESDAPCGAADLSGNILEWTSSLYGTWDDRIVYAYPYRARDGRESAVGLEGELRVVRGGSYVYDAVHAARSVRLCLDPASRHRDHGFRLARSPR